MQLCLEAQLNTKLNRLGHQQLAYSWHLRNSKKSKVINKRNRYNFFIMKNKKFSDINSKFFSKSCQLNMVIEVFQSS